MSGGWFWQPQTHSIQFGPKSYVTLSLGDFSSGDRLFIIIIFVDFKFYVIKLWAYVFVCVWIHILKVNFVKYEKN